MPSKSKKNQQGQPPTAVNGIHEQPAQDAATLAESLEMAEKIAQLPPDRLHDVETLLQNAGHVDLKSFEFFGRDNARRLER
jgi:hypothetical protein